MNINWLGEGFNKYTGYGRMGAYFIRELCRLGVEVSPVLANEVDAPTWLQPQLHRANFNNITVSLIYGEHIRKIEGRQWGFTMYEDTSIPNGWSERINECCERLIVLCEHNAETFKNAGVTVPIHVVYGGTDPDEFPLIEDVPERPYTFMCLGDAEGRKGVDIAWSAFFEAFGNTDDDVRLIIKVRPKNFLGIHTESFVSEPRIRVWREDVESMTEVYREADYFVFPSFGEGWGMPPREAAMMGLPVIATNWAGLSVGINHWAIGIDDYDMRSSLLKTKNAQWAVPKVQAVAREMRWCYENPEASSMMGNHARAWLCENQTWTHSAHQLVELLEVYG